ncbi:MAG: YqjF family protein [Cyclobacteriaceae bacterium]
MSFLKAEWRKLAIANYKIDPAVLVKYVPPKTELDLWHDTCYVSLVGFMFLNTKLLGVPIPFHRNFEEVNLRFYVRHHHKGEWRRGVVFAKEIVPKAALTFVANTIYKEHYQTMKMSHNWQELEDHRKVKYSWWLNGNENVFSVKAALEQTVIIKASESEFITEHYWGYTKAGPDEAFEYEVTHPRWNCYEVIDYKIDVDFASIYGEAFTDLTNQEPTSVMLAEGSEITVENKRRI